MSIIDLVDDINVMLDAVEPPLSGAEPPSAFVCCIYKVPSHIRTLNENAYTPKFVSIGPFHHGHPQHQNMERHKLIYFKAFLQRTNACLKALVGYIDSIVSDFPRCYSETLTISKNDLVKLILIDSGFIIQLFWRRYYDEVITPRLDVGILYDLLLLENQLPFFVIEEICKLSLSSTNARFPSFRQLAFDYFSYFNKSNLSFDHNGDISIRHFTDLIRIFHLQHPIENLPVRVNIDIRMTLACGLVNISAKLDRAQPPSTIDCCIYKVPSKLRKLNEDAYTPNVVSIGPFHHGHPQHQNMERHKLINFKAFLQRTKACSNILARYIESILSDFRGCYSETLQFSQNDLVELILIDSGFIIQLFWTFHYGSYPFEPWLHSDIKSDLLLLENQLPFFVIEEIYKLSLSSTNASVPNTMIPSFLELTINYFQYFNKSNLSDNGRISIRHFTDLIRTFHLQHPIENLPDRVDIDIGVSHQPSASELLEAGVRFKVNPESKSLLDFTFSGGVLKIPKLRVEDRTETLFRNMVALEQCYYPYKSYIIDYVAVMDYLINTGKDVDILVQKKILENWLGDSDSVANLFNGLCKNVNQSNISPHFSDLSKELNDFCSNPWNKLKASLRLDYCNTPWHTAASFAGIILLVLTLLQTVCSVLQVVQQPNAS